ncbi:MAG: hypothetical protein US81_C0010G0002 [Parcubacteria group bacterium GW2011_GWE2_38_18]|nr:MAG: hypothetical protein US81_C0010G0002 [Parcubacteria group bacterium GW2011_GWE2_38_18]
MKSYRLGNQPQEYELRQDFLGWTPENEAWSHLYMQNVCHREITIVNPVDGAKKTLFLYHFIIKEAFPMSFFSEERSRDWWTFAIVSEDEVSEKFIIPLP